MAETVNAWRRIAFLSALTCSAAGCTMAWAAQPSVDDELIRHQQMQQQARDKQLTPPVPDIRLAVQGSDASSVGYLVESPCFMVRRVHIDNSERLPSWAVRELQRASEPVLNRCIGGQGFNLLMGRLQDRLIDHGWVTTPLIAIRHCITMVS